MCACVFVCVCVCVCVCDCVCCTEFLETGWWEGGLGGGGGGEFRHVSVRDEGESIKKWIALMK